MSYLDTVTDEEFKKKFSNYKPFYLQNVAAKLTKDYKMSNGYMISDRDWLMQRLEDLDSRAIADKIFNLYNISDIRHVDAVIKAGIRSGERIYKKGRPKGAKNKPKTDSEAIDVLKELQTADDMRETMSDDELMRELLDVPQPEIFKPEPPKKETPQIDNTKIREMIAESMRDFIAAYGRDKDQMALQLEKTFEMFQRTVNEGVEKRFSELKPNVIELKRAELPSIQLGVQHKNFDVLLKACSATLRNGMHNNIWIYGPAGTGKSTAAEKVAQALELDYYTDGKMADETKVTGYKDANGTYHTTNFRKAFEFGGVYLADEIDGSMPDALLALNGALANGHCSFPDKIVSRHKDFIFLAAANTTGTGGTIEYVGRFKQDAAFNDRFIFIDWPLDEALEDSLVANKNWLNIVRRVRANIAKSTIKGHLITPRASIYGESLLAAGLDIDFVIKSVLKKGLTEAQWNMVKM